MSCDLHSPEAGAVLASGLDEIAGWSGFQLLKNLSVAKLGGDAVVFIERNKTVGVAELGYITAVLTGCLTLVKGFIGVAAMAVKLRQLDFVGEVLWYDYSLSQVIRIISFSLAICGLHSLGNVQKAEVQRFLLQDYEALLTSAHTASGAALWKGWNIMLSSELTKQFKTWQSILAMATLETSDIRKLLIHQDWEDVPETYRRLLTEQRPFPKGLLAPRLATEDFHISSIICANEYFAGLTVGSRTRKPPALMPSVIVVQDNVATVKSAAFKTGERVKYVHTGQPALHRNSSGHLDEVIASGTVLYVHTIDAPNVVELYQTCEGAHSRDKADLVALQDVPVLPWGYGHLVIDVVVGEEYSFDGWHIKAMELNKNGSFSAEIVATKQRRDYWMGLGVASYDPQSTAEGYMPIAAN